MDFKNFFPTVIGEKVLTTITSTENFEYIQYLENTPYTITENGDNPVVSRYTTDQNILNQPLFNKLTQEILKLSKEYLNHLGIIYKDVQICNSWGVFFNKGEFGNPHHHPNSLISGVYYLTEGAQLNIYNSLYEKYTFISEKYHEYVTFTSQQKSIILFPSFIPHEVCISNKDKRYSIAFNIIPKGEFGSPTAKIYL